MPIGVQCPISSSLGEFPRYWDWLWCPGLLPELVSIALPFAFQLDVFHSLLSAIGVQSCFFFTADVSPPIQSILHLLTFSVSFQAGDWLWNPMLWSQRRNISIHTNLIIMWSQQFAVVTECDKDSFQCLGIICLFQINNIHNLIIIYYSHHPTSPLPWPSAYTCLNRIIRKNCILVIYDSRYILDFLSFMDSLLRYL